MDYKEFTTSNKNETAIEAVTRYENLLKLLNESIEDFNESESLFLVDYKNDIGVEEYISKTEKRYNIELPKSYKKFMVEKGPFSFGKDNLDSYLYSPLLDTLAEEILATGYYSDIEAIKKDFGEDGAKRMEELIVFKKEDDYAFSCFDISTYNPKTKEMIIFYSDQDDWLGDNNSEDSSFDEFIIESVSDQIESVLDYVDDL